MNIKICKFNEAKSSFISVTILIQRQLFKNEVIDLKRIKLKKTTTLELFKKSYFTRKESLEVRENIIS